MPTAPRHYRFSLPSFEILNTRAADDDTDFVGFSLAIGRSEPQVLTKAMGDVDNGTHAVNLAFDDVLLRDEDIVTIAYHITNSSKPSTAESYVESTLKELASAGAKAAAEAAAPAVGVAIGAALGTEIPVPVVGTALGALAGWAVSEAWNLVFPDCDGPVALGIHIFTGAQLRALTSSGSTTPQLMTDNNPGVDSNTGCGSNSEYKVSWALQFLREDVAPLHPISVKTTISYTNTVIVGVDSTTQVVETDELLSFISQTNDEPEQTVTTVLERQASGQFAVHGASYSTVELNFNVQLARPLEAADPKIIIDVGIQGTIHNAIKTITQVRPATRLIPGERTGVATVSFSPADVESGALIVLSARFEDGQGGLIAQQLVTVSKTLVVVFNPRWRTHLGGID